MKYAYKIIHYVDGNGKDVYRVKRKIFLFVWAYITRSLTMGAEDIQEYDTEENALACAEYHADECRKKERNVVSVTKMQY